jgi:hypothetical protein
MNPINQSYDSNYQKYLASEEFAEIRQAVFQRDNYKCAVCGKPHDLEPHHLTYIHLYNEDLRDLITLCSSCHKAYHAVDSMKISIDNLYREEIDEKIMQQRKENQRKYQEERDHEDEVCDLVSNTFKHFLNEDYCKNGDYNLCDYSVIGVFIDKAISELSLSDKDSEIARRCISKQKLQNWVRCRRLEFLQRCMEKGLTIRDLCERTKFDFNWLNKYYKPQIIEAQLKQEKLLGG